MAPPLYFAPQNTEEEFKCIPCNRQTKGEGGVFTLLLCVTQ